MSRIALVLLGLTTAALAAPPSAAELAHPIRSGSTRTRRSAAVQLAAQIADGRTDAVNVASRVALSDDRQVRGLLLGSLVDAGRLPRAAARRVPTSSQLGARLQTLGRGLTPDDCVLALRPDRDELEITCTHLVEARCLFDTIDTTTVTIGDRWVIAPVQRSERPNNLCDF